MAQSLKAWFRTFIQNNFFIPSVNASVRQRNEFALMQKLIQIFPDITKQYTNVTFASDDRYNLATVRALHTFQISLLLKALTYLKKAEIKIADIGDSSGTHIQYLKGLEKDLNYKVNALSVNLDPVAVEKIKSLGLAAALCRAEDLHEKLNFTADLFTSFEMLEHLFNPISFLKSLAEKGAGEYFVATVPYLRKSRVGMHHIRANIKKSFNAENTHIFELSPEDWKLIFKFSGWEIIQEDIFTQYPQRGLLKLTKPLWRRLDFEGFYGVILKKDSTWSSLYSDS